jgi:hypothetical protein
MAPSMMSAIPHTPILYFALRGGGNNFGIVTRFDLVTFPQGDLWVGSETFLYSNDTAVSLNDAFYYMNKTHPQILTKHSS